MSQLIVFPSRPLAPTTEELELLSKISQESLELRLKVYIAELDKYNESIQLYNNEYIADKRYRRLFNYCSLFAGTILATCALALGAYGIEQGANIAAIALLIAPIVGLAGVFLWGYMPKTNTDNKHIPLFPK